MNKRYLVIKPKSLKRRTLKIFEILAATYPDAKCALNFKNPLELLIATILSAQCTDARVNMVTPFLFKKYNTVADFASAKLTELEVMIRSTGFFKNKAKAIQGCCQIITSKYGNHVPETMEDLVALPGVGRKTANVVRGYAFKKPAIICDTHVLRVSARLGLTLNSDAGKVEWDLSALLPEKNWTQFSTVLMFHGRRCCTARNPACGSCPVLKLCPEGQRRGKQQP